MQHFGKSVLKTSGVAQVEDQLHRLRPPNQDPDENMAAIPASSASKKAVARQLEESNNPRGTKTQRYDQIQDVNDNYYSFNKGGCQPSRSARSRKSERSRKAELPLDYSSRNRDLRA